MRGALCFRSIQPEQEPVVEVCRIIDSILIENERASQRTQLEQPVPVGGVPSQTRNLQPHHQTCLAESNLADKLLKTVPSSRLRARFAKIAIEDVYAFERPSQRHGAIT